MTLHFDFKKLLLLCVLLIFSQVLGVNLLVVTGGILCGFYLWQSRDFSVADCIFGTAFLMNVWYVSSAVGNVRQYDYFNFVMFADHFIRHDFFVFQPAEFWRDIYFQPPLWGLVSALITKFCMFLGETQEVGFESVRFISLFCVSGTSLIFWRLMNLFRFVAKVQLGIFALFCFFPANSILANLVNNDAAVYFLMLMVVYVGCRWYLSGSWQDTFALGGLLLVIGMIKFSGLMLVPAVGMLGICRLLQVEDKFSCRVWGQFGIIGLGGILGFSWGWFLLYHHLPLVPPPLNVDFQNMSGFLLTERLFSLSTVTLPFADVWKGQIEPNVFLALVKTALFGEWSWAVGFWVNVLYGLGLILGGVLVVSFFSLWRYLLGGEYAFNLFVATAVFSVIVSWMNFWLSYPYFCSSEFRYVAILLPLSLLWLGNYLSQKKLPKAIHCTLAVGLTLFIIAKFMLYLHTI